MQNLLQILEAADDEQLDRILRACIRRKQLLHPEWELCLISLPSPGDPERESHIEGLVHFLNSRK